MPDDEARARLLAILSALRDRRPVPPGNLTAAAIAGDTGAMQLFLDHGEDIEQETIGFASPLCAASAAGKLEAVRWLLDRGARVVPEDTAITPLFSAIRNGHLDVVDTLVARGARLEDAQAAFLFACATGLTRTVRGLVERGLDLETTIDGKTLRQLGLEAAQASGEATLVERYLRNQPVSDEAMAAEEQEQRLQREQLADGLARERGEEPIVRGPQRDAQIDEALRIIQRAGDHAALWADEDGERVLGLAARTGVVAIVVALLERGADPNHTAPITSCSPLHRAAEFGHHELVTPLLARRADPNALAAGRVTPLMLAAQFGDRSMVAKLVAAGAAVRVKDVNGRSPADYASGPYAREIAEMLATRRSRKKAPSSKESPSA